ncbi:MAG: MobF family relaxase [Acidimicrobiales bacterium]
MLNIGKLAAGQQRYYLDLARLDDYYTGRGEAPGRWFGALAPELGLDGIVDAADLGALLEHRNPATGEKLNQARMPGFDLTFRAPKSVSILYGLGEAGAVTGEVVAAHEAAVDAAVGYLERNVCRTRRFIDREITPVEGDGFIAAGFRHQTSRAGDPTLHTHVLVANATRTPDGRWGALDGTPIYHHARTAGFLYQAQLRAELTRRLGVEWLPVAKGCADVAGIPRDLIDVFSQRRTEILDAMEARAEHSPRAAQVAALDTRKAKVYDVDANALRADWAARADEAGFGVHDVADLLDRGIKREPQVWSVGSLFDDLASPEGVTQHASTFERRDVVRALAERLPDGGDVTVIEDLAEAFLTDARLVALDTGHYPRWTTRELLVTEARLVGRAHALAGAGAGVAVPLAVDLALGERPSISEEQAAMVRHLTMSGAGIDPVIGAAGTGKTYTLDAARAAWEASRFSVYGAALSARAAAELRAGSGIASTTIARFLSQLDDGRLVLDDRSVVVIDEAGMVGTRTLDAISRHTAAAGAKLVLVGDTAQLPEIDAGGSFRALTETLATAVLVENRRQIHHWEREALDYLRGGNVREAVTAYDERDRIFVSDNADALRQRLVDDWAAAHLAGDDAVMIAAHRADVRDLNDRAREHLDAAGHLGHPRMVVDGRQFAVGDRVLATGRNHYDLDILNGDLGVVTAITDRGVTFRCQRVDAERTMPVDRLADGFLDHGYARTTYKTQGATADRVFTLGEDGDLDRQAAYTALSRGRIENRLYMLEPDEDLQQLLAEPTPAQPGTQLMLDHIERELSRDRSQHRASEHLYPLATELLAALPEPEGQQVGHSAAELLAQLPAPTGTRTNRGLAADLLAELPDPIDDHQLADDVADINARLDQLQHRPPAVDDGFGIDL